jgi:hypothetical protein
MTPRSIRRDCFGTAFLRIPCPPTISLERPSFSSGLPLPGLYDSFSHSCRRRQGIGCSIHLNSLSSLTAGLSSRLNQGPEARCEISTQNLLSSPSFSSLTEVEVAELGPSSLFFLFSHLSDVESAHLRHLSPEASQHALGRNFGLVFQRDGRPRASEINQEPVGIGAHTWLVDGLHLEKNLLMLLAYQRNGEMVKCPHCVIR